MLVKNNMESFSPRKQLKWKISAIYVVCSGAVHHYTESETVFSDSCEQATWFMTLILLIILTHASIHLSQKNSISHTAKSLHSETILNYDWRQSYFSCRYEFSIHFSHQTIFAFIMRERHSKLGTFF